MVELAAGRAVGQSLLSAELVGRAREQQLLVDATQAAAGGRGGVVFVLGEAGIGKSRLVQAVAQEAARGMALFHGRAVPTATPVPYRPFAEALTAAVRGGAGPAPEVLAPFRAVLARLIPDWLDPGHPGGEDSVVVLAEGVLRFLGESAAGGGCLLVLEDLHWADPESLAIVEYLADHLAAERVLCLATVRDEEDGAGLRLARTLHARRASSVVELGRLGEHEVDEMLASCLGAPVEAPELRALAARADGVPFLVEELLAVAASSGALVQRHGAWAYEPSTEHVVPLTFADSVRRRLATLGSDGRQVLGAAAILGRRFDWELLAPITGLAERAVVATLHAGVGAQLVSLHDDRSFRFRHALSRDAVLAELLPPERVALSRRALDAIERSHPGLPGPWCELAAEVAVAAGDRDRAAVLLLEGGRRALGAGALATAEAILGRARSLATDHPEVAVEVEDCLLSVLVLAGDHDEALEQGRSLLGRLGDRPAQAARRAEVRVRLARAAWGAGLWAECDEQVRRAREEAATMSDDALSARIDIVAAQAAILRRPAEAADLARAALDVAHHHDLPEVACEALEIIGRHERGRDLAAAGAAFQAACDLATARHLEVWRMRALHELGTVDLLRDGDVSRFEQARELSVQLGAPSTTAVLDVQIGSILAVRDDPGPAIAVCRRAQALARRYRLGDALAAALAFEGVCHARAGDRTQVQRCITEALEAGTDRPEVGYNVGFVRAQLALVLEDHRAARRAFLDAAVDRSAAVGVETTGPNAGMLSLLLAVEGDDGGARRWLEQPGVHFIARGHARYAEAVLAGRAGNGPEALALIAEGDAQLEGFAWYRHLGRRLVAEAAITDGWGEPACRLVEALAFFDAAGDARIASACRSLLRRTGTPVPRRRGDPAPHPVLGPLGVTAREAEVLGLLGEGLSNRDIGARLYMSPRTVERHVASLCAKTGTAGRAELIAFAARIAPGGAPV